MKDVMLDEDRKEFEKHKNTAENKFSTRTGRKKTIGSIVKESYRATPPAKRRTKEEVKKFPKTPKKTDRWVATELGKIDGEELINKWCPDTVRCRVVQVEGRYLLYQEGSDRRSVSWTARGGEEAVREALRVAWRMHKDTTGEDPPKEWPVGFIEF